MSKGIITKPLGEAPRGMHPTAKAANAAVGQTTQSSILSIYCLRTGQVVELPAGLWCKSPNTGCWVEISLPTRMVFARITAGRIYHLRFLSLDYPYAPRRWRSTDMRDPACRAAFEYETRRTAYFAMDGVTPCSVRLVGQSDRPELPIHQFST